MENRIECVQENIWTFLRRLSNYSSFERYARTLQKLDKRAANLSAYEGLEQMQGNEMMTQKKEEEGNNILLDLNYLFRLNPSNDGLEKDEEGSTVRTMTDNKGKEEEGNQIQVGEKTQEDSKIPKHAEPQIQSQSLPSHLSNANRQPQLQPHSYELHQKFFGLVILSPPWGGPEYLDYQFYDIRTMLTCGDGYYLSALTASVTDFFVMILPRNTPNEAISQICNVIHYLVTIENIYVNNKCKVKVCYFYRPAG